MQSQFSSFIEYSFLQPTATIASIEKLCNEAKENNYAAVCIPPLFVKKAKLLLSNSPVKISTVVGFPFGYSAVEAKLAEIVLAILDGVDEMDVVINIAALKNNDWQYLAHELNAILPVVKSKQKAIKIIIEAGVLTDDEIIKCCDLYGIAGVDFLQTSTGFSKEENSVEKIKLIRKHLADAIGIKAIININNDTFAQELTEAGATRLGLSMA
ncbi:MAG: deoxyribose-phosphate aldolase [Ferruginibacter sp.]